MHFTLNKTGWLLVLLLATCGIFIKNITREQVRKELLHLRDFDHYSQLNVSKGKAEVTAQTKQKNYVYVPSTKGKTVIPGVTDQPPERSRLSITISLPILAFPAHSMTHTVHKR